MRKLVYYVGMTIDGCIAGPEHQYEFMLSVLDEDYTAAMTGGYSDTLPSHVRPMLGLGPDNREFDTVVMGRATYEPGVKEGVTSPYAHLEQYVVSKSLTTSPDPDITVFDGDPVELVRELKAREGKAIYLCGGANVAGQLRSEIDELVVKIYPFVAGDGIRLFDAEFSPERYELKESRTFANGAVVVRYARPAQ
ncbi:dihydrofolate reductase family protein [Streptomyces sp. NPDC053048]|uniref:dihydrofolate reductase family protein n=1 Tax=Streptomyces sp. NPDC053048 TaxID=3365694 RepID=UPI0037D8B999